MHRKFSKKAREIMDIRFKKDTEIALATVFENRPYVRTVNSYYEDGAFYGITYALSNKMRQIAQNPNVAISGEWFTAHGIGENRGHLLAPENAQIAAKLQAAFSKWYSNGDIDPSDPNTCIFCIHLTDGVLFSNGKRYDIDFKSPGMGI